MWLVVNAVVTACVIWDRRPAAGAGTAAGRLRWVGRESERLRRWLTIDARGPVAWLSGTIGALRLEWQASRLPGGGRCLFAGSSAIGGRHQHPHGVPVAAAKPALPTPLPLNEAARPRFAVPAPGAGSPASLPASTLRGFAVAGPDPDDGHAGARGHSSRPEPDTSAGKPGGLSELRGDRHGAAASTSMTGGQRGGWGLRDPGPAAGGRGGDRGQAVSLGGS